MYVETLYADTLEELDGLVDSFTTDKIVVSVNYIRTGRQWQADVFYVDTTEK